MKKVTSYIDRCRAKGFSDFYIRSQLKQAGYSDALITQSFLGAKSEAGSSGFRPSGISVKPVLGIVLGVVFLLSVIAFWDSGITGYAVSSISKEDIEERLQTEELLQLKEQLIFEKTNEINALNLTVKEKQHLIAEQTLKIEALFEQIQRERREQLEGSIELINSLLT